MYVPPAFRVDRDASLAFAAERGFGLMVASDDSRPVGSALPFIVERDADAARLQCHVPRGNPLATLALKGSTWLVSVQGIDTYVSPDWYASTDQVPTWLYEMVHLSGPVSVIPPEKMVAHLDMLSAKFENQLLPKRPWLLDKVTAPRRETLLSAIVGIEMRIETIEGSFKLNQHKSDADHIGVVNALRRRHDAAAQRIARRMVALRPQLSYE